MAFGDRPPACGGENGCPERNFVNDFSKGNRPGRQCGRFLLAHPIRLKSGDKVRVLDSGKAAVISQLGHAEPNPGVDGQHSQQQGDPQVFSGQAVEHDRESCESQCVEEHVLRIAMDEMAGEQSPEFSVRHGLPVEHERFGGEPRRYEENERDSQGRQARCQSNCLLHGVVLSNRCNSMFKFFSSFPRKLRIHALLWISWIPGLRCAAPGMTVASVRSAEKT